MKTRYFIFLSYKGTSWCGWQIQPGAPTIQESLDKALSVLLGETVRSTGAGRTDAGVHASFFCAHFESSRENLGTDKRFLYSLNGYLPGDIAVSRIENVVPDAHARFSAISRTYKYYITRVKKPFALDTSWYYHGELDVYSMNIAAGYLKTCNNFTSFGKLHSGNRTNICSVYEAAWSEEEDMLVFTIKADRFLRNMVRSIVGTLVKVGSGKMSVERFKSILEAADRRGAGQSAPASGLFLSDIEYPDEIFTAESLTR